MTVLVVYVASAETALDLLDNLVNSYEFRSATNFLDDLENGLRNLSDRLEQSYYDAKATVQGFADDLDNTLNDLNHEFDTAMNEVQGVVDQTSLDLNNFIDEQRAALSDLTSQLESLLNSAKAAFVKRLQRELEDLKNDDTLLVAARKTLDGFDKLQQGAFDTLDGLVKDAVGDLVNIEHVSLEGRIAAAAAAARGKQAPFVVIVKGRFGGTRDFEFRLEWVPWREGADDASLFKRLGGLVMGFLNGEDLGVSKLKAD